MLLFSSFAVAALDGAMAAEQARAAARVRV
jgi:hypothetical protein